MRVALPMSTACWPLALVACVGCADAGVSAVDLAEPGPDAAAAADAAGPGPIDLGSDDGPLCQLGRFTGFVGPSPVERRFACPCGCLVDPFEATTLAPVWTATPPAAFHPTATGLTVAITLSAAGVATAGLSSRGSQPFFLDGDFDLTVEYVVTGALPNDITVGLGAALQPSTAPDFAVWRRRATDGTDSYAASLAGMMATPIPTMASAGTLELVRKNTVVLAVADGMPITQLAAGSTARLSVELGATLGSCAAPPCTLSFAWHALRLGRGTLVDRP